MVAGAKPVSETVGFMSRIDYGSEGFRRGLLEAAFEYFTREGVRFIVLQGGLISRPAFLKQLPRGKDRAEAREVMILDWARELAEMIPSIQQPSGDPVKIYLVIAPAPNYDGDIGEEIAHRLARLRDDIVAWGEENAEFPLKYQGRSFASVLPKKGAWAQQYYSNMPERLIREMKNRTSHVDPVLWVSDCNASAVARPKGELSEPYITVPALHKLQEVTTNENQIGVRVVEFFHGSDEMLVRTYNFKDIVASEYSDIPVPDNLGALQREILHSVKTTGPMTIGMLTDAINRERKTQVTRDGIRNAISNYNNQGFNPAIELDEDSGKYDFSREWFRREMRYQLPSEEDITYEALLGFGCLHAGSKYTKYDFFLNEVPELMIRHGTTVLVGAGDFIEGLKHDLILRGEVYGGLNYTEQEEFSAKMIGAVMLRVFKERFESAVAGYKKRSPSERELDQIVNSSLVHFRYAFGNHDMWVQDAGHTPLAKFYDTLVDYLAEKLEAFLHSNNLLLPGIRGLVKSHITLGKEHVLESGLSMSIRHPHMARALTSSLRAQHGLREAQSTLVISANFHVAVAVEQWQTEFGQRIALQLGTIKRTTDFEENKLKRLDVGVGLLRVGILPNGRVFMAETLFAGPNGHGREPELFPEEERTSDHLLQDALRKLGIED